MTSRLSPAIRPQPMIGVTDVARASRWYQRILGATSGHGGDEYDVLMLDSEPILQLHRLDIGQGHAPIGDPGQRLGNGVAVWFEADEFDAVVDRIRQVDPELVADVHVNPNARQREIWFRDPDGYLIVVADSSAAS